jgi:hypothetical protein
MPTKVIITVSAMLLATANSRAEANTACILKATESLPRIHGLVVKKTRTRPVTAEILATWRGQTRPIIVNVDIVATGAEETYSYLCALTKGSAYVRRVMMGQ